MPREDILSPRANAILANMSGDTGQDREPHRNRLYELVQALRKQACFKHPATAFEIIETHISYVLLTGPYAYKFKKPLNLGFLDFSTLESRKFYCEEELRLNKRLAPDLYVDVVPVTGSEDSPVLGGDPPAIEYAVRMVQFPKDAELDHLTRTGHLTPSHIDQLAEQLSAFHGAAAVAPAASRFGSSETIRQVVLANFSQIRPSIDDDVYTRRLDQLEQWTLNALQQTARWFRERKQGKSIRECHGDLHLGNIACFNDRLAIFDCIEFSEELRWIDVMSEVAFLLMDLDAREQPLLAQRFLNAYLEITGDYEGLQVLRFYRVYRALVRCKVACIRLRQAGLAPPEQERETANYRHYIDLACRYIQPAVPALFITHGPSGSGKTSVSQPLLENLGAIRIRSDVERKRLHGLDAGARTASGVVAGIYSENNTLRTYERLAALARVILTAGYPVIVDATFLQAALRRKFRALAAECKRPFVILDFQAQEAALRARIEKRARQMADASEADSRVLDLQIASREPLDAEEVSRRVIIDTTRAFDVQDILRQVNLKTGQQMTGSS